MTDVSVVMSVYNGADHLRESMDSILSQQGLDFEFVIVNDGSTDESAGILDEYAGRDERIRVIHQENRGLTQALIRGCAEARGIYIARQDAGDISFPERLALQKKALDADLDIVFVSCWTEFCGPKGEFLYVVKGTGKASTPISIISEKETHGIIDGPSSHPSAMFRREAYLRVGGYRQQFYFGQDWDLWYRLAECGKFQMVAQVLYKARIMAESISSLNKDRQEELACQSFLSLINRRKGLPDDGVLSEAARLRPRAVEKRIRDRAPGLYFIGECLRKNGDAKALAYFREAVHTDPFFLKGWLRMVQMHMSKLKIS